MIGKITPLVKAAGRRVWLEAVIAHILGSVLSAGALGFVLAACGMTIGLNRWPSIAGTVIAATFLCCALQDTRTARWHLPALRRQTPASCQCTLGTTWAGFVWGVDLAQGWTTFIVLAGYYALVVMVVLTASPVVGALSLGMYGLGRAAPVLAAGLLATRVDVTRLALMYGNRLNEIQVINGVLLGLVSGLFLTGIHLQ